MQVSNAQTQNVQLHDQVGVWTNSTLAQKLWFDEGQDTHFLNLI